MLTKAIIFVEILQSLKTYQIYSLRLVDCKFLLCNEQCTILQLRNGMKKRTVEAEKRYLIYEPPPVLTLHLKRFEQVIWEFRLD